MHDAARATVDIDLVVESSGVNAAIEVARQMGFVIEAPMMTFRGGAIQIRRISKPAHGWHDDVLVLDLWVVTDQIEAVWRDRQRVSAAFGEFWVVSREGLVTLKRLSGRARDLADIERLLETSGLGSDEQES